MNHRTDRARSGRRASRMGRATRGVGFSLLLGAAVAACDGSLLDVEIPGRVVSSSLNDPALANTLVNSALGRFECAYTSYVASTGMLANEFINSSGWLNLNGWGWRGVELYSIDGGCPTGRDATGLGAYTPLQQARYVALEAARLITDFPDASVDRKAEKLGLLNAYAGYATQLLGEGFCEMVVDQGPIITKDAVFALAEERFTAAITFAGTAGNNNLRNMALTGRARARLNRGDLAGAATDAAAIPQGFVWNAEYSTVDGGRENRIFNLNRRNRFMSVNPADYANLTVEGQADTRVSVASTGLAGHDNATIHWNQNKYPTAASPIPMASWREAQLILAEARPAEAEAAINRLRASQGLPAITIGTQNVRDVVLEERRRQLFAEGHRLNDMLRYNLPFPQGNNHKNQPYGPITCMPLPDQERNTNPNVGPRTS
jgi:starch-binding outer membrane protein, SusD/RagB family